MKKVALCFVGSMILTMCNVEAMEKSTSSNKLDESNEEERSEISKNKNKVVIENKKKEEKITKELLESLLTKQQYKTLSDILERSIYPGENASSFITQWFKKAVKTHDDVFLKYCFFRYTIKSSKEIVLCTDSIRSMMGSIIITTVLARGDYEVCHMLGLDEVFMMEKDPVGLLLKNYKHRLKGEYLKKLKLADIFPGDEESLAFKNIIKSVKELFSKKAEDENFYKNLPSSAWLLYVSNTSVGILTKHFSEWIGFSDVPTGSVLLELCKKKEFLDEIMLMRKKTYENVLKFLEEKIKGWEDFFDCNTGTVLFTEKYSKYIQENKL